VNNRYFDTAINDYKENYCTATGNDYDDSKYPTLDVVPDALKNIVSAIKIVQLEQRQLEIKDEIDSFPSSGDAHVIPDDKKFLLDENEELEEKKRKWK